MNRKAFKQFRETMKWWTTKPQEWSEERKFRGQFNLPLYYEILKQRKHETH